MPFYAGPLVGTAADLARDAFTTPDLSGLIMKSGLAEYRPRKYSSKGELVMATIENAQWAARDAEDESAVTRLDDALLKFAQYVAIRLAPADKEAEEDPGTHFYTLREAARADGLDFQVDRQTSGSEWNPRITISDVKLVPFDDSQAPLGQSITALRAAFDNRGMAVARSAYDQALANLVEQRFEACNAQLRAMLEATVVYAASQHGFTSASQGAGGPAITFLRNNGHLPPRDGGDLLSGLWAMTHTNGSHPGMSNAGEAFFRVQVMSAVAWYVLDYCA